MTARNNILIIEHYSEKPLCCEVLISALYCVWVFGITAKFRTALLELKIRQFPTGSFAWDQLK